MEFYQFSVSWEDTVRKSPARTTVIQDDCALAHGFFFQGTALYTVGARGPSPKERGSHFTVDKQTQQDQHQELPGYTRHLAANKTLQDIQRRL